MLRIKDWSSFQSYKDRNPPWIRFHKKILDGYEFQSMTVNSRAMLPMLWLLASEDKDPSSGMLRICYEKIAFRLRTSVDEVTKVIDECVRFDFIEYVEQKQQVTELLQNSHESVTPETETETYNKEIESPLPPSGECDDEKQFEDFWESWEPYDMKKGNKFHAKKSFQKALKLTTFQKLKSSSNLYCSDCRAGKIKTQHIATWLNQHGWENQEEKSIEPFDPIESRNKARLASFKKTGRWNIEWGDKPNG
jgi:hypothetical protein